MQILIRRDSRGFPQALLLGHLEGKVEVFHNYIKTILCPSIFKERESTKWKEGVFKPF